MSGYIMNRESLKRHCEEMCERFKGIPTSGAYGEHSLVLDLLKQTEWIPVSERLPEKSTWVLVTCKNPDGYIYLDIKLINRYTELWDGDEDFIGTVLAWMPLPKPYKAECDNDHDCEHCDWVECPLENEAENEV